RQLIEATPWGRAHRSLVRDRDAVYGRDVVPRANKLGIRTVLTPLHAPRANAVAERLVGTLRRACLDHPVIINEAHLRALLTVVPSPTPTHGPMTSKVGATPTDHSDPNAGWPPKPAVVRPARLGSLIRGYARQGA